MLKEMTLDDFKALEYKRGSSADADFAEKQAIEFMTRDLTVCEVTGWPSGDAKKPTVSAKYANYLRSRIKKVGLRGIAVKQRGNRVFLLKEGVA